MEWNILKNKWVELHSFAENDNISIQQAKLVMNYYNLFQLPLSMIAHEQFNILSGQLEAIRDKEELDTWSFMWGNSKYSAKKIYNVLVGNQQAPLPMQWTWKTCFLPRHKFF